MGSNGGYIGYDATPKGDGKAPGIWGMRGVWLAIQRETWPDRYLSEVFSDNPVAYWRLDETSGTTAVESVAGRNGVYTGATLNQTPLITSRKSVLFSGSGSGIVVPDAPELSFVGVGFTIEQWVSTSSGAAACLARKDTTGAVWPEYIISILAGGTVSFDVRSGNADNPKASTTTAVTVNDGNPHHIVGVFTPSSTIKIYVDGIERASSAHSIASSYDSSGSLKIGRADSSDYLAGKLDEVALYASALSAARVLAHYNAGIGA